MSVELFRFRGGEKDGGTLEYVFESDEKDDPKPVTKEQVAKIAADFITSFTVSSRRTQMSVWTSRKSPL
jgi:hypothetical protein